jgi:hypothetical protein
MPEYVVMVSHLQMDQGTFRRGEIIDLPPERGESLGSSVKRVEMAPSKPQPEPVVENVPEPGETPEPAPKEKPAKTGVKAKRT